MLDALEAHRGRFLSLQCTQVPKSDGLSREFEGAFQEKGQKTEETTQNALTIHTKVVIIENAVNRRQQVHCKNA